MELLGGAGRVVFVRQQHGLGDGYSELGTEGEVEELIIGAPPEGVVDDDRSGKRRVLEVAAIEGDVVGDAIDDDVVGRGLRHAYFANDRPTRPARRDRGRS